MSNTSLGKSLSKLYELFCENGGCVTTDSRSVASLAEHHHGVGPLFFALKGEHFDGNQYAAQAIRDGAVASVVARLPGDIAPDSKEAERYFVVKDTLAALQELASYHRDVLGLPIVALTGSNGKTTTKELITRVLRTRYRVAATGGNLNNHIGVPLTLLSFTEEDDVGIVEMGANHRGEIVSLCGIAMPDIGLITNIGRAHLEGFGGPDGVRAGKGELYDYLATHDGTVIYSLEDPVLSEMIAERSFGTGSGHAVGYAAADFGISVTPLALTAGGASKSDKSDKLVMAVEEVGGVARNVATHMAGDYNMTNILAALAVGRYFGVPVPQAVEAVADYVPDNNRSQIVTSAETGNTLYMDAYNANPSSMAAAIGNFLTLGSGHAEKVLILGDMRELGEFSAAEHRAIVDRLLPYAATTTQTGGGVRCFFVGPEFAAVLSAVSPVVEGMQAFDSAAELVAAMVGGGVVIRDSQVLVKGSRGLALEQLYSVL